MAQWLPTFRINGVVRCVSSTRRSNYGPTYQFLATRTTASSTSVPAPGLLAQLPDYATGASALQEGRFSDALPPLQRASEVAAAYFPDSAANERALCHSAHAHCLWSVGRFADAATEFEKGLDAARGRTPSSAVACLAEAAARAHFETGNLSLAAPLAAESAAAASSIARYPEFLVDALRVIDGQLPGEPPTSPDSSSDAACEFEALQRTHGLLAKVAAMEESAEKVLEDGMAEGSALAQLLVAGDSGSTSPMLMALRSTVGQLAVGAAQGRQQWVRPMLVAALNDFDVQQPADPSLQPLKFRTLGALGTVIALQGDAMSGEGLFRAAVDNIDESMQGPLAGALKGGRGCLWRSQVFAGFADLLEQGRRAEQRASEIAALRARAAEALTPLEALGIPLSGPSSEGARSQWALLHLPSPRRLGLEDLSIE